MPSVIAFDTHAYVKKLRDVGVPEPQAEIQAEAMAALIEDRLATKEELKAVEANLRRDIKELEVNLKRDLKELENKLEQRLREMDNKLDQRLREVEMRMTIRLGTIIAVATTVLAILIKLL